ncbi:MAG TPA: FAD-binding protein [Desulfobacteria bacterium]|nr:FAD-binding protein [Desulfobacteria bacterium]
MNEKLGRRMEKLLGSDEARILEGDFERELYSTDIGDVPFVKRLFDTTPDLVILPKSVDALKKIVRFANDEPVAIVPRGSASSGLGGVVPTVRGLVLDFSAMDRIVALNREVAGATLKVQAGVRWSEIEEFLKDEDLSVRAYPSSFFSTVGGWIATGGYGIGSFRFGHLRDQIESIEVMFTSGEIKSIQSGEEEFARFFGSEGQFGIIISATLKLRKRPKKSLPHLLYFGSTEAAFSFVEDLIQQAAIKPYHIKYVDAAHFGEVNRILDEDLFSEKDAVLVVFEEEKEELSFLAFAEKRGIIAEDHLAHYLWHERLFPMKRRGCKKTPLACELVMPLESAVQFLNKLKRIIQSYRVDLSVESHIVSEREALVMLTYASDVREPRTYLAHLMLIPILTRLGLKFGGVPYGVGIWNSPFLSDKYDKETLRSYKAYKRAVDPQNILNPNKFFAVKTKWANVPGMLFRPLIFRMLVRFARLVAPVLATPVSTNEREAEESVLENAAYSCVKCGSCAAHCPAYTVTSEASVIPKNKLMLAKKILAGGIISKGDSDKVFLCTHCGMCRDICQNDLDLPAAWLELEERLGNRFGRPDDAIRDFVATTESSERYWRLVNAQKV